MGITTLSSVGLHKNASVPIPFIPSGITTVAYYAFSCQSLEYATIPGTVTTINSGAFSGASALTGINSDYGIVIPGSVKEIGACAFQNCALIRRVKIPASVSYIGIDVFGDMPILESLEMPLVSQAVLGDYFCSAYSDDENATKQYLKYGNEYKSSYKIPLTLESVTILGTDVPRIFFNNCTMIKSITVADTVKSMGEYAFDECSALEAVYITDIAAWCSIDFDVFFSPIIHDYTANPLVYARYLYVNGERVSDLVIPDTVKEISSYAFFNCESIETVTLPTSLERINEGAFGYCNTLEKIYIPWDILYVSPSAFENTNITVYFEGTQSMWNNIFKGESSGLTVVFNYKKQ